MSTTLNLLDHAQGHALLIGVSAYQHVRHLPPAVCNDVTDLAAVLYSADYCGYPPANVTTLTDAEATRSAVLAALDALAERAGPDDTACVFFSGHGAVLPAETGGDGFLLTVDTDPDDIDATAISTPELSAAFGRIRAPRLLVFVDACHAGGVATIKSPAHTGPGLQSGYIESTFKGLAVGRGRALMASCRPEEYSHVLTGARNSVFTTALLSGLCGAADTARTGFIRVFDLFDYVSQMVPTLLPSGPQAKTQRPVFQADSVEDNFPVALNQSGRPALTRIQAADITVSPAFVQVDQAAWHLLETSLVETYPGGPREQEVWSRAGGDLARLALHPTGLASWHAALRTLKQGGGGKSINFAALLTVALADFPHHPQLLSLQQLCA